MKNLIALIVGLLLPLAGVAQKVTQISTGHNYTMFIKSDGTLWGIGLLDSGELGIGAVAQPIGPAQALTSDVTAVAVGANHTLFIRRDGSLWGMGANGNGELGYTNFSGTNVPVPITTNVTAIAAGPGFSLFIKSDGSLWGMGYNYYGQLGDGIPYNGIGVKQPVEIVNSGVIAVAAGDYHSLFLKSDGSLWGMGDNEHGQLGDINILVATNMPVMLMANGVKAIAAGYEYSLVIKTNGSLWATGYNDPGALGDGSDLPTSQFVMVVPIGVTAIAAGRGDASLFLKSDGSFWGMGNNASGIFGDGTYNDTNAPEELMTNGVIAIGVGTLHSVIIKSDGSLWTSGDNSDYQLGVSMSVVYDYTNRFQEIIVGSSMSAGFGQLSGQLLGNGNVRLSYVGLTGTNYALDRTFNLSPVNWVPQATNPAGAGGVLLLTNMPDKATNNFWRIRSVP